MADVLLQRRDELISTLVQIATYGSATHEVDCAVRALRGSQAEITRHRPEIGKLAVFLPSNNLLYSYVLFGLVPGLYSEEIVIRPAARYAAVAARIHELLWSAVSSVATARVDVRPASQRAFVDAICRSADVVVFNGRYHNGIDISGKLPADVKMLLFGSGPNPVVVGPAASVEDVVEDVVAARIHNVGQDCLCSDIYLVHSSAAGDLIAAVCERIEGLEAGDRGEPGVDLAPLAYPGGARLAVEFIDRHQDLVVRQGDIHDPRGPQPVVLATSWNDQLHPPEFFSPVFLIMTYDEPGQIREWLASPPERRRGMYLSVYGEPGLSDHDGVLETSVVCHEQTALAFEDGNAPFGGYGEEASCIVHQGQLTARPLLLSAEVATRRAEAEPA